MSLSLKNATLLSSRFAQEGDFVSLNFPSKKHTGLSISATSAFRKSKISTESDDASSVELSLRSRGFASFGRSRVPVLPIELEEPRIVDFPESTSDDEMSDLWLTIRIEAAEMSRNEPALASYLYSTVLSHKSLERSLSFHLANKLSNSTLLSSHLFSVISEIIGESYELQNAIRKDLSAVRERDAACDTYIQCLLNFKGFLAIQTHRVAHKLWTEGRKALALALQSRISEVFHVDIHPAAKFGVGVMFDHATGIVIGETAEIGNNVSILHNVTLGGTGKAGGNRHPKVKDGVLIGAGATILGNIIIGEGAKIGAGSMVLESVPPKSTAVGNPAKLVGKKLKEPPSQTMDQMIDYVI